MLYWRLAFRNLLRHRGRLILNLILLVGAFSTIVCFKGFKSHVLKTIHDAIIDTQYGHLQVAQKSFFDNLPVEQNSEKMVENADELADKISHIPGVQFASPRVEFYGLMNTEEKSVNAHFIGLQPLIENRVQTAMLIKEGHIFDQPKQTIVSTGMKTKLNINAGTDVTVVSTTLNGGVNAMDLKINGVFSTGFADIDNGTVFLNLKDSQRILDTDAADKIIVTLNNENEIPLIRSEILKLLTGTNLQVKTWRDLAELYNQVENFYIFQNFFIELIILMLLLLSVANTVSMTVFERLSEIGTLRALGDYESDVRFLFLIESFLLGVFAVLIAIPVSLGLIQLVTSLNWTLVLPLSSLPIPFKLVPTIEAYLEASIVCLLSVMVASLWPARKGSQVSIVIALGAKI